MNKSNTSNGVIYVVKLLVSNPSEQTETVPPLELDGKTKTDVYTGHQVESKSVSLEPGESKYVHYAIVTKMNTLLDSLNVLTTENFTKADAEGEVKTSNFTVGRLNIGLPGGTKTNVNYEYGTPILFEKWNDAINQDLDIALMELHVADNQDQGSKVAFAKFKVHNKGLSPVPIPTFETQLSSPSGFDYAGARQAESAANVVPGTSSVVSYAFVLPLSEKNDTFIMNVQDVVPGASSEAVATRYKSTLAAFNVAVQSDDDRHNISLYPYKVNIRDYFLSQITVAGQFVTQFYTYKLKLDLDIMRDPQVLVDNNFSKLKFELVDPFGGIIGSKTFPFTGKDRLVNGLQTLTFTNLTTDQVQNNLSVKVYEAMNTPTGEVDRLITLLK